MIKQEDFEYMERALQIAAYGAGHVSPNPMVGAVITAEGRIIGEGWHRKFGEGHAEVNAVASVKETDRHLLKESTVYVTLEPCSHYGKTPPCAAMLAQLGVKRVVVGSPDPNPLVSGRGIRMLREAGIEVEEGVMQEECDQLNRRFLTAQRLRRPWIQLKWAMSADGFMGVQTPEGQPAPCQYSTPVTLMRMHRERSMADGILVGGGTVVADRPSLTVRKWPGRNPKKVAYINPNKETTPHEAFGGFLLLPSDTPLEENMRMLFEKEGISALMVEGGAETLRRFMDAGLYDEIRVETAPAPQHHGIPAPTLPGSLTKVSTVNSGGNIIEVRRR